MPVFHTQLFEALSEGKQKVGPAALIKEGPFFEVFVSIPQALAEFYTKENIPLPAPIRGIALLDTGASKSCVHAPVMRALKVSPIGVATSHTAAGSVPHSLFPAHFTFPVAKIEIDFASVVGVDLSGQTIDEQQLIALIGRDVLAMGLFVYNGSIGSYSFAI
jgi:hypothetical protein